MRYPTHVLMAIALAGLLAACGGQELANNGDSAGGGSASAGEASGEGAPARKALETLFQLIKEEKNEAAAAYVIYIGRAHPERRWKDTSNYGDMVEKAHVDAICGRLKMAMKSGAANFKAFRKEKESEGEWLIWTVGFGTGIEEMEVHIACLEVKGRIAIGDID